ncbi:uncharacterized protein ACO6RY_19594 [Pungitius sinensis]
MASSSQSKGGKGLWKKGRVTQFSKGTQDMLQLMMQQSKLTHLQRKKINESLMTGATSPPTSEHTSPDPPTNPKTAKYVPNSLSRQPQRRSAEACRSGNSYVREKYHPGPLRDLEKEKRRLQNILATGKEEPTPASYNNVPTCSNPEVAEQKDRYQEVLDEIEERRQFLADMSSLGEEKKYVNIINTEISQRIRELRVLDKARSPKKGAITTEQKERITEKMEFKETRERRLSVTD